MQCCIRWSDISAWFQNYDHLQSCAIILLYFQVACALIGSLGALYSGVLLANLALALFALVAIESGSQTLGRTYAALLAFALVVDIVWFILFSNEIGSRLRALHPWIFSPLIAGFRNFGKDTSQGKFTVFSTQLTFWMQTASFCIRFLSSFLWLQIYRIGAHADDRELYQPVDFDGRIGGMALLTPDSAPAPSRESSQTNENIGGSIYNPATFSSLFESTEEPYFGLEAGSGAEKEDAESAARQYQPPDLSSVAINLEHYYEDATRSAQPR